MRVFGGMTYTWRGSTRTPCVTSATGIRVVLDRMSVKMLGCFGSRCWMNTRASGASTGRCDSNSENASNPPAEAPMPTIGNASLDGGGAATLIPTEEAAVCSRFALRTGEGGEGGARLLPADKRVARDDLFTAGLYFHPARRNASTHHQFQGR